MRVFIAIELDNKIKDELDIIQDQVKNYTSKGTFKDKSNVHLTLHFLGKVDEHQIESLKSVIDDIASSKEGFDLELNGIGNFPKKNKKIIWVGLTGQVNKLQLLYDALESQLDSFGFDKEERDYHPHITLGRQILLDHPLINLNEVIEVPQTKIEVDKISLMESKRKDGKLVYESLYVNTLQKK